MTIRVRTVCSAGERDEAFAIRKRVFQDEQGVPAAEEFDADDDRAIHLVAEADGAVVATGRIIFNPDYAKVGRMAVLREWRRRGVGRALLERFIAIAAEHGAECIVLHAQVQAIPFYLALGFVVEGGEFLEAGIPHRRMIR